MNFPSNFRQIFLATLILLLTISVFGQINDEPRLFAEGLLSRPGVSSLTISADGQTIYFAESRTNIMASHLQGGKWGRPERVEFSTDYSDGDPFVSPDGKQMFFWSTRPTRDGKSMTSLWVSDRTDKGWGAPHDLGPVVNANGGIFPSVAANGNLYFSTRRKDSLGQSDIYRARRVADGYAEPENLGPVINSALSEWDAYIAPDESYMVFTRQTSSEKPTGDLFISQWKNGAWTTPRNLGPKVNSAGGKCCPAMSRDGKYFYFGSNGTFQIDSAVLGLTEEDSRKPVPDAVRLAEGVISTPRGFALTFSPDGKTAYFAESRGGIMRAQLRDGNWGAPEPAVVSRDAYYGYPFLSPDGKRLLLWSDRSLPGGSGAGLGIWVSEQGAGGWGEATPLGAAVNGDTNVPKFSPAVAANGNLYFTMPEKGLGGFDIYRAKQVGDGYAAPENLGPVVNSDKDERDVYVSPDESFIIFTSNRPGGVGGGDLYLSQWKDGAWTAPRNLGPKINSSKGDAAPMADAKYLYFQSTRSGKPEFYQVPLSALGLEKQEKPNHHRGHRVTQGKGRVVS